MSRAIVIVGCADCGAPITMTPKPGYEKAEMWQGLMICNKCAAKRRRKQRRKPG
jgi:hypothetical protein